MFNEGVDSVGLIDEIITPCERGLVNVPKHYSVLNLLRLNISRQNYLHYIYKCCLLFTKFIQNILHYITKYVNIFYHVLFTNSMFVLTMPI